MTTVTIGKDGLIEIPENIAKHLNIKEGDILKFKTEGDKIIAEKTEGFTQEDVLNSEDLSIVIKITRD